MSNIAYRDSKRTQLVYANECTILDRNVRFYCENPDCMAHLYVRAIGSTIRTHFYAPESHPHTGWCRKETTRFEPTSYQEELFNFDIAIDSLIFSQQNISSSQATYITNSGDGKERSLSKIAQIYSMCKTYHPNDTYNGFFIWQMLFDNRNNYMLTKGLFGKHLIECFYTNYDKNGQYIYFHYPLNPSLPNHYKLRIHIENTKLFYKLLKKIYNTEKRPIVIAGNWGKYDFNSFECHINSGKPIYLP